MIRVLNLSGDSVKRRLKAIKSPLKIFIALLRSALGKVKINKHPVEIVYNKNRSGMRVSHNRNYCRKTPQEVR